MCLAVANVSDSDCCCNPKVPSSNLTGGKDFLSGSGSGLYSGGLTWSIVLRCDDHTDIFTCDGCARDPYFYVPAETQSYVIKLSCSRKVLAASAQRGLNSEPLGYNGPESATAPATLWLFEQERLIT